MIKPPFRRILIANRGEIAIRVMRAASELGIATVAIYSQRRPLLAAPDQGRRGVPGGRGQGAARRPTSTSTTSSRIAREARVDAIHPGYGFLSENPEFAERCAAAGIIFIGPDARDACARWATRSRRAMLAQSPPACR